MMVSLFRCCPRVAVPVALLVLLACCLLPRSAAADPLASDWAQGKQASVRLLADPDPAGGLRLGLQFRLQPGWKTYWRAPGDAGLPATIDWSGVAARLFGV